MLHIGMQGFRTLSGNKVRTEMALQLLQALKGRTDLVVFPAGYLLVKNEMDASDLLAPVFECAKDNELSVILGVDEPKSSVLVWGKPDQIRRITVNHCMPCYLYAYSNQTQSYFVWRQRTMNNQQAADQWSSDWLASMERSFIVNDNRIEVWICGECYDPRVRNATYARSPDVVLILSHYTMPRFARTLKALARSSHLPILQTDHRSNPGGLFPAAANHKVLSHRNVGFRAKSRNVWVEGAFFNI